LIEHIPFPPYSPEVLLKELVMVCACGGHVALKELPDGKTSTFLSLQGNFEDKVKAFLIARRIADKDGFVPPISSAKPSSKKKPF
jgi:translation initiation factor 1 (eIF-1/SUI1)